MKHVNKVGPKLVIDEDIPSIANADDLNKAASSTIIIDTRPLASIGFDRIVGFIEPSAALADPEYTESYGEIDVQLLQARLDDNSYCLVDVRNQKEWDEGRIPGATHIMLGIVPERLNELPEGKTIILHCRSGARSAIAASLLQANGFKNVLNVNGGYLEWTKAKLPVTK